MPGMEMGFGMEPRLELRPELRIEHRLEQRLQIACINRIENEGTKHASKQHKLLQALLKEAKEGRFAGVDDFYAALDASGKSHGKSVLPALRCSAQARGITTYEEIQQLLEYGIRAYERRNWTPSVEYEMLTEILSARTPEIRARLFNSLYWELSTHNFSNYPSLVKQLVSDRNLDDIKLLTVCEEFARSSSRAIDNLEALLGSVLPATYTHDQFHLAADLLAKTADLMPQHYHYSPEKAFASFVRQENAHGAVERHSNIFLPVLACAYSLFDEEGLRKLNNLCKCRHVQESRDTTRQLYAGLHLLTGHRNGQQIAQHMLRVSQEPRQLEKLLEAIMFDLFIGGGQSILGYDPCAATYEELYAKLRGRRTSTALEGLGLPAETIDLLESGSHNLPPQFIQIVASLANIYRSSHPNGLKLLGTLTEKVLAREFREWRYTNPTAQEQLKGIDAREWRETGVHYHTLKLQPDVAQKLSLLNALGEQAAERYEKQHNVRPKEHLSQLEQQIHSVEGQLREGKGNKKVLGPQAGRLREQYLLANTVDLFNVTPTNAEFTLKLFKERHADPKFAIYQDEMRQAIEILSAPALRNLETVIVTETDDYLTLLNVGVEPVKSCQRWTEQTGYNECLLAYPLDANKKALRMTGRDGQPIARAIIRYLPIKLASKNEPMPAIILEPAYALNWSDEYAMAAVIPTLKKAGAIAKELGKAVIVGYTARRSKDCYSGAFEKIAKNQHVKIHKQQITINLPPSMNSCEYSDALGGKLNSGSTVKAKLRYIVVDPAVG